ncbi:uncharacterized protein LOC128547265 [Mercenaria mercenaria]|uniref:uncharacterized protein LOC128547265 n=1 Tax=Mercenaria mercenaria TaxID=6596 RepID=UPI00234EF992|nr:uncharacterized protein LOC128547265 [Mercenaria mercenaria]
MVNRIYVTLLAVVCHLWRIHGSYIPPGSLTNQCQENDDAVEDAMEKLATFYTLSSFNTTMYAPQSNSLRVDMEEYNNIRTFCSNFRSKFQTILDFKFLGDSVRFSTSHLSTCPWVLVDTYDENRLPKVIPQAKCVCNRCLQKISSSGDVQYIPRLGRCKPVMTSVMTVRRQCNVDSGFYEYTAKAEKIAVGCTCTSPVHV